MKKRGLLSLIFAIAMAVSVVGMLPEIEARAAGNMYPVYRFLDKSNGDHFLTANTTERDTLIRRGWQFEGVQFQVSDDSANPVYRLVNSKTNAHHYTISYSERLNCVRRGWTYEGIAFYSGGDLPVYRMYNPRTGRLHFTPSSREKNLLLSNRWEDQGIGFYGYAAEGGGGSSVGVDVESLANTFKTGNNLAEIQMYWDSYAAKDYCNSLNIPYTPGFSIDLDYDGGSYEYKFGGTYRGPSYYNGDYYYFADSSGRPIAVVCYGTRDYYDQWDHAGIAILSSDLEMNIGFETGPFGATGSSDCWANVLKNGQRVREGSGLVRSYTGAWTYGICNYDHGRLYDYQ